MLVNTMIVTIYIAKGLLFTVVLIGLIYIYIGIKDEIEDRLEMSREERKLQQEEDDEFFKALVEEQRLWLHSSKPLW